jgi:hypothetical protein
MAVVFVKPARKNAGKRDAAGIVGGNASRYIMVYSIARQRLLINSL